MPTVQVEAQLSSSELLEAVKQLDSSELENFANEVLALKAQRRVPSLPAQETDLLLKINQGVPDQIQRRYDELSVRRRDGTITPEEHGELLDLIHQIEQIDAKRVEYLSKLAEIRGVSVRDLMDQLGIDPPDYA